MRVLGLNITRAPRAIFDVKSLDKIKLGENDVLVLHCDRPMTADIAASLEAHLKKIFGDREILVLDKGMRMTVLSHSVGTDANPQE